MVNNININIDMNSLSISNKNIIIGKIHFSIGEQSFPEKNWNDFVITILGWWLEALWKIETYKEGESIKLYFKDGPFEVIGKTVGDDSLDLEFLERKLNSTQVIIHTRCSLKDFRNSIEEISRLVVKTVEDNGWDTNETRKLKQLLKILKQDI